MLLLSIVTENVTRTKNDKITFENEKLQNIISREQVLELYNAYKKSHKIFKQYKIEERKKEIKTDTI